MQSDQMMSLIMVLLWLASNPKFEFDFFNSQLFDTGLDAMLNLKSKGNGKTG
jgi:hypothetical protein